MHPQETNSVKAVQLRITFGQHWANVTAVEGGTITVEREGKKLAITPYLRDAGKVELRSSGMRQWSQSEPC